MEKLAAYSSSKAALTMFSAVMRQELSKWGVKVSVIQPGGFRTSRCLSPRVSSWKGCWESFVLKEFKLNPSALGQRGVGMDAPLLRIKEQGPVSSIYGCSPVFFHKGIKFWCHVFFKHYPLFSEKYNPLPFYPGRRWPPSPLTSLNSWTLSRCRLPLWLGP